MSISVLPCDIARSFCDLAGKHSKESTGFHTLTLKVSCRGVSQFHNSNSSHMAHLLSKEQVCVTLQCPGQQPGKQKVMFLMTSLGLGFLKILLENVSGPLLNAGGGGEYDIMTYYYNLLSNIVSLISLLLLLCFPGMCCFAFGFGLAIPIFSFLFLIKYFPRGSDNGWNPYPAWRLIENKMFPGG